MADRDHFGSGTAQK